jgi:glutamate synthase (NADPH/NADH) small chain
MTSNDKNKKPKRIKIPRSEMPLQDAEERIKNFSEVALGYSEEDAIRESSRCLQCKNPVCIEGCPVEIDIKSFINLVKNREFDKALEKIREKSSLPAICGRVCPQEDQCEKKCILGIKDDPVAIGRLERFVADWEQYTNNSNKEVNSNPVNASIISSVINGKVDKSTHIKAAIIGSGPAGLTCAGELAKMGYGVTIFEALHEAGGVLRYGIPEFRLPKIILKREVEFVKSLGVEMMLNTLIGKTFKVNELFDMGYKSIFIGTGAGLPYFMKIPGENLNGVYSANEYLTRSNLMKAYLFPDWDTPIKKANRVAVVGGGNVAMDSARVAKRLGAEHVFLIYRRSEIEMPARIEEVRNAKEEGIEMVLLTIPVEIIGESGWVKKIRCIKAELGEPDSSGRRRPIPIKGSEIDIDVDVVVMAIGQGPNPLLTSKTPDIELNRNGNIVADPETFKTSKVGVFAGGDIVSGAATVILAMGAGKTAAKCMDEYIRTGIW